MISVSRLLYALLWLILCSTRLAVELHPNSVPVKIVNRSGAPIDLFWVNTLDGSGEMVRQISKPIRNSSDTVIHSFDTHQFVIKYYNTKRDGDAQQMFVKGPSEETITVYSTPDPGPNGGLVLVQSTRFDDIKSSVEGATRACMHIEDTAGYDTCVADMVSKHVQDMSSSIQEMKKYRDRMAAKLRNYTCADDTMESSIPLKTETLSLLGAVEDGENGERTVEVETLLDMPASRIWVAHNFVSDAECDVLMKHATPRLKRATVAAEDGTSIVSETRKAQQASYNFPKKAAAREQDPLWALYNRILGFVNAKTSYDLRPEGQEEFAIIQYNADDEYAPHCDADCAGETYTPHGRVATAVLYCRVAERGGGTSFSKSDVFVKPRKGDVTFFSYKGPDNHMDTGYTEHSGCPVVEGEKWITTAWLRQGVTADDPWDGYDPSGIPIYDTDAEMKEQEVSAD